nr:efflux transporter outer membrane subunit [uncultured Holophaga sp.]
MKTLLPAALGTLLLATGCKVQTEYQKPKLASPATFTHGDTQEAQGLEATAWWKQFQDPELDSLMSRAVAGSLDVTQAQARILQARATLGSAKADQWPSVNATASMTREKPSQNASSSVTSTYSLYQAGFDASWEIDLFGGKRKAREAAQARLEASVEDLGATVLTLQGDVATNYISLRSSQAQLEIARKNAEVQRQTTEVTEERFRLGLVTRLDVAQAKAQLASTQSDIPTYEAEVAQYIHRLSLLLGQDPTALTAELSPVKALPSIEGVITTGLPSELLSRRPDLRKAERNLAAAMADVGVARADLYPKFDLTLGLGLESLSSASFAKASSKYASIVPGLSLPIFNRGSVKAAVAKDQAIYQEDLAAFQASYHTALEDVENALASYAAEKTRHATLAESVKYSQEALELAQERYRRGLINFIDVLTAQTTLQSAQNSLSLSDAKLLTNLVSLYKALGGGWKAA